MKNEFNCDILINLSDTDYDLFCEHRKDLIADFFHNQKGDISELQSLQREIEFIRASQCSPGKAVGEISELINLRVKVMMELAEKLICLQDCLGKGVIKSGRN